MFSLIRHRYLSHKWLTRSLSKLLSVNNIPMRTPSKPAPRRPPLFQHYSTEKQINHCRHFGVNKKGMPPLCTLLGHVVLVSLAMWLQIIDVIFEMKYICFENIDWSLHEIPFVPLTHWGRVTHICVAYLTIIASGNGLLPSRCQAIIWTNAGIMLISPLGTNLSEILIKIHTFSFQKMQKVTILSRPQCVKSNQLQFNFTATSWNKWY